jgi:hypothetical protein
MQPLALAHVAQLAPQAAKNLVRRGLIDSRFHLDITTLPLSTFSFCPTLTAAVTADVENARTKRIV